MSLFSKKKTTASKNTASKQKSDAKISSKKKQRNTPLDKIVRKVAALIKNKKRTVSKSEKPARFSSSKPTASKPAAVPAKKKSESSKAFPPPIDPAKKQIVKKTRSTVRVKKSVADSEKKETAKAIIQPLPLPPQDYVPELPDNYGDNLIYLLVRDPYAIYTYWEIQPDHQQGNLALLGGSWDRVRSVLRIYDTTDERHRPIVKDIVLRDMVRSWYIETEPNHSYFVEIGLLHNDGRYISLARSNHVTTPRSGMSEIIDEQWMSVDFDKIYALSGGFSVGKSSEELKKLMEERFQNAITSGSGAGAVSSLSSPVKIKPNKRDFRFWLECELIIYGGTEPDAKVTMQGRPVGLRPDGTFTLRYGLPDGKFTFNCRAESADGIEERIITPIISRNTERPSPIFKAGKKK